jgi:transcriptional regulator with XRE-family HTH domain
MDTHMTALTRSAALHQSNTLSSSSPHGDPPAVEAPNGLNDVEPALRAEQVGARLRQLRQAAGMTVERLSEASGVSVRAIGNLERGTRSPLERTVRSLTDALGVDENTTRALLTAGARTRSLRYAGRPASRCFMPAPEPDLAGRESEIAHIKTLVDHGVPAVLIVGGPGIGKTSVALTAARELTEHFPHEHFVDLRGLSSRPLSPDLALERLLRSIDPTLKRLPSDRDDRRALYRERLARESHLIVLDCAESEAQIRPLLPVVGPSVVIVTSRRLLTGIVGARRTEVGPLDREPAISFLRSKTVGVEKNTDDYEAIAAACGFWPLALRVAANRLGTSSPPGDSHPGNLAPIADPLVEAAFVNSHDRLSPPAQRVLHALRTIPSPTFTAADAAAVTDDTSVTLEQDLDELVEAGLLRAVSGDRFHLPELVRLHCSHPDPDTASPRLGNRSMSSRWSSRGGTSATRRTSRHDGREQHLPAGLSA